MTSRPESDIAAARTSATGRPAAGAVGVAVAADVAAVVIFVLVGRRSHAESDTLTGILTTAWPFLVGGLAGWVIARGWRAPAAIRPTGVCVWLVAVAVGMVLRAVSGQGVAASFVVVATIVLGVLVVGWRGATRLAVRRQARRG